MGNCCSGDANLDSLLASQMDSMKISSLSTIDVKSILYANVTSINGFDLTKLSEESLNLYKRTLKTMSSDTFIKVATENFYELTNPFHVNYFKLLSQSAKSQRATAFLLLIPLAKDTNDEKMKYFLSAFFALNNQTRRGYAEIKEVLQDYITNTLTIPYLSIKMSVEDVKVKEQAELVLGKMYNEKNFALFVNYLFEGFERKINEDEEGTQITLGEGDLKEVIENYKYFLFDYLLLKEAFTKKIG